jgi:hypothetical protein
VKHIISLSLVLAAKSFSRVFFKTEVSTVEHGMIDPKDAEEYFKNIQIFGFLNHTTLLEPLLFTVFPNWFYFKNIKRVVIPGADITLSRPIVGTLYKIIFPQMVSISRKRDHTWDYFMNRVKEDSLVVIAPEGRMKRPNGLDKHGKPMTIKGGIVDIILQKEAGYLLLGYSGGLHHVQRPGSFKVSFFKRIKLRFERLDIQKYKQQLKADEPGFKERMIADLTSRMEEGIPK